MYTTSVCVCACTCACPSSGETCLLTAKGVLAQPVAMLGEMFARARADLQAIGFCRVGSAPGGGSLEDMRESTRAHSLTKPLPVLLGFGQRRQADRDSRAWPAGRALRLTWGVAVAGQPRRVLAATARGEGAPPERLRGRAATPRAAADRALALEQGAPAAFCVPYAKGRGG